ncbi:Dehydrogenase (flavoprotein) [Desulfonispora thiosulfatigenes DSM 11270]|uniref:Dehydrogenase (Flavoprotein) n=1 Tax=Desulfonispora thiosulfatigenes DSM 11270 TaxID=656914 RepID=A0A1W1UPF8_DESTI|nr:NAD(P)/FAD-dependent oxidoreductase [Desulfonispora thiosulfatigenes]SMB82967.1 Dehydrogenase (flavoprotein) [Desulfonispora thiosulfatigenes DSM 11270]
MKVAIMGAGLAGLACAITLEKFGIEPIIFEDREQVGDRFKNGEIILSLMNRPVRDALAYLSENYEIFLSPIGNIKAMNVFSENNQATIEGQLGFSNIRGRHQDSMEAQLARQVKSKIFFNSKFTYEELLKDFTHVILATGDAAYAKEIQNFKEDLTVTLKGAIVEGNFNCFKVASWLDSRFAPQGYGYMIPLSKTEANIVIAYPEYPENQKNNLEEMWKLYFQKVCKDIKQDLKIVDNFEVNKYIIGTCQYPRIGNTFFVGNNFGSIMPFLGFGQYVAILTGIYAAMDLCGQGSYEELTKPLKKAYTNSLVLRRAMEKLDNKALDTLVKSLDSKIIEKVFNTSSFDPLRYVSYILRPLVKNTLK